MKSFQSKFVVEAPFSTVVAFHASSAALKKLSPPPVWVHFHRLEPLAEGSVVEFTLWFLIIPFRWKAVHSQVSQFGFVDRQESGPLKAWKHEHRFIRISDQQTQVEDRIDYQHFSGWKGLIPRLLFNAWGLKLLFLYRQWVTRYSLRA